MQYCTTQYCTAHASSAVTWCISGRGGEGIAFPYQLWPILFCVIIRDCRRCTTQTTGLYSAVLYHTREAHRNPILALALSHPRDVQRAATGSCWKCSTVLYRGNNCDPVSALALSHPRDVQRLRQVAVEGAQAVVLSGARDLQTRQQERAGQGLELRVLGVATRKSRDSSSRFWV